MLTSAHRTNGAFNATPGAHENQKRVKSAQSASRTVRDRCRSLASKQHLAPLTHKKHTRPWAQLSQRKTASLPVRKPSLTATREKKKLTHTQAQGRRVSCWRARKQAHTQEGGAEEVRTPRESARKEARGACALTQLSPKKCGRLALFGRNLFLFFSLPLSLSFPLSFCCGPSSSSLLPLRLLHHGLRAYLRGHQWDPPQSSILTHHDWPGVPGRQPPSGLVRPKKHARHRLSRLWQCCGQQCGQVLASNL